jgi:hypothetical protein
MKIRIGSVLMVFIDIYLVWWSWPIDISIDISIMTMVANDCGIDFLTLMEDIYSMTHIVITQILRVTFAWHMRQIQAGWASHPRIRRKCCAHLPRATRDVTFWPLVVPAVNWTAVTGIHHKQMPAPLREVTFSLSFWREVTLPQTS